VDLSGALVNGLLAIIGYVAIFVGVYKVNQIAGDIREIKGLVASARHGALTPTPVAAVRIPEITTDLMAEDSAAAYAQSLLRAVNAESHTATSEPHNVR
jgi:uncharacterized membrane protein